MFGNYWTTEQGCLSPSSVGRSELDHWERELAPTWTAALVLLFITSLLPWFLINILSSRSYCLYHTCAPHSFGNLRQQRGDYWSYLSVQYTTSTGSVMRFLLLFYQETPPGPSFSPKYLRSCWQRGHDVGVVVDHADTVLCIVIDHTDTVSA